jgi:hypothetical protein
MARRVTGPGAKVQALPFGAGDGLGDGCAAGDGDGDGRADGPGAWVGEEPPQEVIRTSAPQRMAERKELDMAGLRLGSFL